MRINGKTYVRVDIFKPSGKWYTTEYLPWPDNMWDDCLIHDAFAKMLIDNKCQYTGMRAICLEPYHKHAHPISYDIDDLKWSK